ncbi:Aste57867_16422 [Aphanomyces stellatus]|uniref:Aste57867_16422 protein n=1 Tax=Aphanomyces stellatus TaxID=120398 RepID=A0A485L5S1_9STRA|nr:hypothetical protein As57867_016365 [Aphanomyces stellatus]VFT93197.1 Aste57867_16422 [Aphanomyces stellatus]
MAANVSFGGCGFLLAFHVGVAKYFRRRGVLTASSRFAGASGGALVAASLAYDVPLARVLDETKYTARAIHHDLATHKRFDLSRYVAHHIDTLFPDPLPVHATDRLVVATTELWPRVRIVHWTRFVSKAQLTDRLLLSCHVPWYFNGTVARRVAAADGTATAWHADGGLLTFVPAVDDHVNVNVFPTWWDRASTISPAWIPGFPVSSVQLVRWALLPPSNDMLDQFAAWGEEAAAAWEASSMAKTNMGQMQ